MFSKLLKFWRGYWQYALGPLAATLFLATMPLAPAIANMAGTFNPLLMASSAGVVPALSCTGGTITTSGANRIHTFTASGTLTCTGSGTASYLIVAGGAGGALGGGGAGGVLTGSTTLGAGSFPITVGTGGTGVVVSSGGANGNSGNPSTFAGFTALLGGGGGSLGANLNGVSQSASTTGSGGGGGIGASSGNGAGGLGTAGQGNNGGAGVFSTCAGGGGGAGAVGATCSGSVGGGGGAGISSSISGSAVFYGGGGGGGASTTGGAGGNGGGGAGSTSNGTSATANTGGGGGGATNTFTGGNGGSGVVIVSYLGFIRTPVSLGNGIGAATSTTIVVSFGGGTIVTGDLLIVIVSHGTSTATVTSVTDGTNTYVRATSGTQSTNQEAELWYCINATGITAPTLTATFSASVANRLLGLIRVPGGSPALDVAPAGVGSSSASPTVSTGVLASTFEIIFGFLNVNGSPTLTEGPGFTTLLTDLNFGINQVAYQVVTSTASVAYSPTESTSNPNVIMVAAFK